MPESDGDDKANISASFVAFVYGGGEKSSNCKRNEPSPRAVALVVWHLRKSGIRLSHGCVGSRGSLCACWHHTSSTPSLRRC